MSQSTDKNRLVIVYHREPLEEHRVRGKTVLREHKSPNGIIPTLRGVFRDQSGLWVAWKRTKDPQNPDFETDVEVGHNGSTMRVHRVPLTKDVVDTFYYKFSKEALWPILFSFPDKLEFNEDHWQTFVAVNERFAEATISRACEDATIWVHDYNLWLVPGMIREKLPKARIGFFHHTPFPSVDIFSILPWRKQIIDSLLACDLVGFHIPRYVDNFADCARSLSGAALAPSVSVGDRFLTNGAALTVPNVTDQLRHAGRLITPRALPVGIDIGLVEKLIRSPEHVARIDKLKAEFGTDRQMILSVERLDYIKGPVEKLLAYERLLENHPELSGKVVFVNVVTPPADGIAAYRSVRAQVDKVVGRINGRFATLDWTPVRYFYKPLPWHEVVAWYEMASICWVTPLRDGLNLVAKEFVAVGRGQPKALIVSEFAGAQVELKYAITVNPYSRASMDRGLETALSMPPDEREQRISAMNEIVTKYTVQDWAETFLNELMRCDPAQKVA